MSCIFWVGNLMTGIFLAVKNQAHVCFGCAI